MPKTNLCKTRIDPREAEVKAILSAGMVRMGMYQKDLAKKVNVPQATLSQHIRNPREMRLGELWDMLDVLKPELPDRIKLIQEVSR